MVCIPFGGPGVKGHICCADYFVSLESFGSKVWCEHHNYLGPTFYRSKNAITPIETPSRKTWAAFTAWRNSLPLSKKKG